MSATLYTIGYQGAKLEQVVASLAAARVSVLVDTRETPMSRRVEFRQRALASWTSARRRGDNEPPEGPNDRNA